MNRTRSAHLPGCDRRPIRWLTISIPFFVLIINYVHSGGFGLYEDDYIWVMTLDPMTWSANELWSTLREIWSHWVIFQGRPIGFSLDVLMAYSGGRTHPLEVGFFLGFVIWSVNGILLYRILKWRFSAAAAFVGSLAFISFCPDVSKVILMHRMIHLAVMLVLAGFLLHQQGRWFCSYLVAASSLLVYESPYLAFLMAPALAGRALDRKTVRGWLAHGAVFFVIPGLLLAGRALAGDVERAGTITGGFIGNLGRIGIACISGLFTTFRVSTFEAARLGVENANWVNVALALSCASIAFFLLRSLERSASETDGDSGMSPGIRMLAVALFTVAFTYCLAFRPDYFPPTFYSGRLSGVHAAAAIPWAVACAAVFSGLRSVRPIRPVFLSSGAALMIGLNALYGLYVQDAQYVKGWEQQKTFWRRLVEVSGSIEEGDCVLIDVEHAPHAYGFNAHGSIENKFFNCYRKLVQFPTAWGASPRVYGFSRTTKYDIINSTLHLHTPYWTTPADWPKLHDNFFYFEFHDGILVNKSGPVTVCGYPLIAKALNGSASPLPTTKLYRSVFK